LGPAAFLSSGAGGAAIPLEAPSSGQTPSFGPCRLALGGGRHVSIYRIQKQNFLDARTPTLEVLQRQQQNDYSAGEFGEFGEF